MFEAYNITTGETVGPFQYELLALEICKGHPGWIVQNVNSERREWTYAEILAREG